MKIITYSPQFNEKIFAINQPSLTSIETLAELNSTLNDSARGFGANVLLSENDHEITGCIAWVKGQNGEMFISPWIVKDKTSNENLLDELLKNVTDRKWVRCSAYSEESEKIEILKSQKFSRVFDFLIYKINVESHAEFKNTENLVIKNLKSIEIDTLRDLHNKAFKSVDNSLPLTSEQVLEIVNDPTISTHLSKILFLNDQPIGFSFGYKNGHIDAIGVLDKFQGKGLGASFYRFIINQAKLENLKSVDTLVSSRNIASVKLHEKLNFTLMKKRTVYERN